MIKSKSDYLIYLEQDRLALKCENTIKNRMFNPVWRFQRALRRAEYAANCKKNIFYRVYAKLEFLKLSQRLGFTIPINVFGPGLSIAHYGTIVVNEGARVGANCRLHVCVNIGTAAGYQDQAPHVGDNCYIGPGVKMFGAVQIGNNVSIGANAVVNKNFGDDVVIAGIPAKIIGTSKQSNEVPA